jgi:hypothetical protein
MSPTDESNSGGLGIWQHLLFPLILAIAGIVANNYLQTTAKLELAAKLLPMLSSPDPTQVFGADLLLGKVLDKNTAAAIRQYVSAQQQQKLREAIQGGDAADAKKIVDAARAASDSPAAQQVIQQSKVTLQAQVASYANPDMEKGVAPRTLPQNIKTAAQILPDLAAQQTQSLPGFWVYLGATAPDGNWLTRTFSGPSKQNPQTVKGGEITVTSDVFKRMDKPTYSDAKGWTLGDIFGVVNQDNKLKVQDVQRIPGTNDRSLWWGYVVPVQ